VKVSEKAESPINATPCSGTISAWQEAQSTALVIALTMSSIRLARTLEEACNAAKMDKSDQDRMTE
jgi:hypothetical protein